jgi:hypothetical protein
MTGSRLPRVSARKWGGNDSSSWAVFVEGQARPVDSGLTRAEVPHVKAAVLRRLQAAAVPVCEWYALCTNPAEGTVAHPVLGPVPTCTRCATKHGLDLQVAGQ